MIQVAKNAREEFLRLRAAEGGESFLRITVVSGGCSGLSYQLGFDTVQTPFDKTIYQDSELKILTDTASSAYLEGLSIDYSDDLIQAGFRFSNPNAVGVCGCGNSFSA